MDVLVKVFRPHQESYPVCRQVYCRLEEFSLCDLEFSAFSSCQSFGLDAMMIMQCHDYG